MTSDLTTCCAGSFERRADLLPVGLEVSVRELGRVKVRLGEILGVVLVLGVRVVVEVRKGGAERARRRADRLATDRERLGRLDALGVS